MAKRKKRRKKMTAEQKPKTSGKRKNASNYIDNDKMYKEMVDYVGRIKDYNKTIKKLKEDESKPAKPRVSEYIGECIVMIANRLATKPNFANYVHREEMVGDGIENCLMYIDNFDPNKSKNPFAYFTQIIYFAFVRRIQKEKKQMYIKMKMLEKMDDKGNIRNLMREGCYNPPEKNKDSANNVYAEIFKLKDSDIKLFEKKVNAKKQKNKKSSLDEYFS